MTTVTLSAERVLDPKRQKALGRVQQILGDLRRTLSTVQADPDDVKVVKESIAQLDELFLLVVVGESNAGKSAFVNALLDQQILEEGVTRRPRASRRCATARLLRRILKTPHTTSSRLRSRFSKTSASLTRRYECDSA